MAWFIQDYDETQIFISDSWGREYYITKFNINKDFPINDEDEVLIQWSEFEKGDGGQKRELKIYFEDVVDGYGGYLSNPTSSSDLRATLLQYYDSGFGGSGDNILSNKADLLSHNGATDEILPGGSNEYILSRDNTESTGLKWISKSDVVDDTVGAIVDANYLNYDSGTPQISFSTRSKAAVDHFLFLHKI